MRGDYVWQLPFNRFAILDKLKNHRERYQETFQVVKDAFKILSDEYQRNYKEYTDKYHAGTLSDQDEEPISPDMPEDKTETYDSYIEMFTHSTENEVMLDVRQFNQFWMDKWDFVIRHIGTMRIWANSFESGHHQNWSFDSTSTTSTTTTTGLLSALTMYG